MRTEPPYTDLRHTSVLSERDANVLSRSRYFLVEMVTASGAMTITTAAFATGFGLLITGAGWPILRMTQRLGDTAERASRARADAALGPHSHTPRSMLNEDSSPLTGAFVSLVATWTRFMRAVVDGTLALTIWLVPLSLISTPLVLAAGLEPTARIASRDWELAIRTWPPALGLAFGGLLLLGAVPWAIDRLAQAHQRWHSRRPSPQRVTRRAIEAGVNA